MTIGFLVDGMAEYHSLKHVLHRIDSPHAMSEPLRADIQPLGSAGQIARAVLRRLPILLERGADLVVVLLDGEGCSPCPGGFALDLEREISRRMTAAYPVRVVVKNSRYENWLVGAIGALRGQPKRFPGADRIESQVVPGKADSVDAYALLCVATPRDNCYHKVDDAKRIMRLADPYEIASNSRSFRRLLRVLDNPRYRIRSRLPQP